MKPVQATPSDSCGLTRPDLVMQCFAALLLNFVQDTMSTCAVSHQFFKPVLETQALTKPVPKSTYAVATWLADIAAVVVTSAGSLENSLGVLLVDFFRLLGRTLNTDEVGISCSHGGAFYNKIDTEKEQPQRMYMLSVEDPADSANDLCRGSWNILKVAGAEFAWTAAKTLLLSHT